jgi:competence protein ComEC
MKLAETSIPHLPAWTHFQQADGAMLAAMVTGDRSFLTHTLRAGFERTGSFHLLVVSGLHLAIVAGLVFSLARWLRLGRIWASLATIWVASGYALLTGLGQPVLRSLLMVSLYLLSRLLFREKNPLNAIGFAAVCLFILQPHAALEAGLQMTLLSVITIAGIAVPLIECWITPWCRGTRLLQEVELDPGLSAQVAQFRVSLRMYAMRLRYLGGDWLAWHFMPASLRLILRIAELLIVSTVMELAMTLPMAVYFHRITVAALPVNILLVPFVSFLLPLALLTFVVAFLWPGVVAVPATATAVVLHAASGLVHWMGSSVATDIRIAEPSTSIFFASILAFALALILIRFSWWGRLLGLMAMVIAAGIVVLPRPLQH